MERAFRVFARILIFGVLALFDLFLAAAGGNAEDKTIASRTAVVDGVRLQYLTAGKGPAVILLHGYAETTGVGKPLMRVLGARFTVIAPDWRGIGDSAFPADGADMKTAAIRIHALARKL